MDKVAEASFNGLRGLVAAEDVEAGQHAMTVSLSEGLFVLSGQQKSSPLPDWFVSPTFFTAEHGCDQRIVVLFVTRFDAWCMIIARASVSAHVPG